MMQYQAEVQERMRESTKKKKNNNNGIVTKSLSFVVKCVLPSIGICMLLTLKKKRRNLLHTFLLSKEGDFFLPIFASRLVHMKEK